MESQVQQQQPPGKLEKVFTYLQSKKKVKAQTYAEFEQKMRESPERQEKVFNYLRGEGKLKAENLEQFQDAMGLRQEQNQLPLPIPPQPEQAQLSPPTEQPIAAPSAPAAPTEEQRADAKQFVTDTQERLEGRNPDRERNPLVTIGKTFWNLARHEIPAALASTAAILTPDTPGYRGMGVYQKPTKLEVESVKAGKLALHKWAMETQEAGKPLTENLVNSLGKIQDPLDAFNWALGAVTQAGTQIPLSLATLGASSFGQEVGSIYLSSVRRIAEEKGITPEQVIERGLDEPGVALAYGAAAGALDLLGAGKVATSFGKQAVKRSLQARALATIKSGASVEAQTEYFQTWLEQIGEEQSAGKDIATAVKTVLTDPSKKKERKEGLAQGFVGGKAGTMVGSATQSKKQTIQQDASTTPTVAEAALPAESVQPGSEGAEAAPLVSPTPETVQEAVPEVIQDAVQEPVAPAVKSVKSKKKKNAIPERSTEEVPVGEPSGDSTAVVEGVPQSEEIAQVQEDQNQPQNLEAEQVEAAPVTQESNEQVQAEGRQEELLTPEVSQTGEEVAETASSTSPVTSKGEEVQFEWQGVNRTGKIIEHLPDGKVKIKGSTGTIYRVPVKEIKTISQSVKRARPKKEETPIMYNSRRNKPIGIVSNGLTGGGFMGMVTDLGPLMSKFFQKEFTSRGFLPKSVFDRWNQTQGETGMYEAQVKFTLDDMKKAIKSEYNGKPTDDEITDINLALQGKQTLNPLPPKVQQQVDVMRAQIDNLSHRFINEGVVSGELSLKFQKNLGSYLNRSYRKHDDPFWAEFVPPQVRNKAEAFLRGKFPKYTNEEIDGLINYIMYDPQAPGAMLKGAKLGSKDLSILKKRGDIAPELRALMGEYADPLLNYARTITKMANLIAKHHFLNDVKSQGLNNFLFERPTGKYSVPIAAEGSRTMAPLNGLFTTQEIAETFQEFGHLEPMSDMLKAYMQLNGWIKLGKTVFSIMTHARNMFGNVGFAAMNGHWRLDKLGKGIQVAFANLYSNDQVIRDKFLEYKNLGVVQDSGAAGELRQYIKDIRENKDFFERINDSKLKKAKNAVIETTKDLYQFEDDLYKIFAFENEYTRYKKAYPNMPDQELKEMIAKIVRDTYPTYSMVPNMVKRFRGNPLVGSFVSFPAEVLRTTYNTIALAKEELSNPTTRSIGAQRAAGIMIASLLPTAMSYATMAFLGLDGQDDEDLRKFVAPWQRNSEFLYLKVTGDKYTVIDLGYSDPHSYIKRPLYNLLKGENLREGAAKAAWALAEPFMSEELLAERIIDMSRNQKKNGDHVYNPSGEPGDIAVDVYNHFKPIAEPGTVLSLRRTLAAYQGTTDKYGNKYELQNELMGLLTGFKAETKDVTQSMLFKAYEIKDKVDRTEKDFQRVMKSQAATGPEKAEAKRKRDAAMANIVEEAVETYKAAIRLGVNPKDAKRDIYKTRSPEIVHALK